MIRWTGRSPNVDAKARRQAAAVSVERNPVSTMVQPSPSASVYMLIASILPPSATQPEHAVGYFGRATVASIRQSKRGIE